MKHELKSIGIFSAAKVVALLYAALAVLMLPFSLLFLGLGIFAVSQGQPEGYGLVGMGIGFLFSPVIYGVMGFLFGGLGALAYNLIVKKFGGLVFETAPKT